MSGPVQEWHPTPDQLEVIFHGALKAGDAKGVEAALRVLAVDDPRRAQLLLDALELALHLASVARGGGGS